ncbi:ABC transporter ATP-binding protein/permease [Methylobacter sp. YRD-M1]|uniref:ABC transporter ATP-binding protein/permease n=1 Tax=Methylobacter sp. YRD-M1 TaxID=2911520 RepID=UPI00227D638C|nr:ABC transporter ATP-binding protein/permease [Methylobacter sp. YRD-M1]WAK01117.1 ABC transporter ATP-binding protein/permease [Methylobacter sp. YRD-M1]
MGSSGFFIQFMRLAGAYWHSEDKATIRKLTLALIALTVVQMFIAVIITEWSAALFDALEQRSMSGLLKQIGLIVLIFAASMAATGMHLTVKRRLQIGWRAWLTDHVTNRWMNKGRHYQVTHIQTAEHDNPDGRIAEDIRIATEDGIALFHSLFYSLLILISFIEILWTLSGVVTLDLGFIEMPIYGHLVWVALIYAAGASALGWLIGQPLSKTTNIRQTMEANYRFGLVKARESSLAIALIHGETHEKKHFQKLFQDIIDTYHQQTRAWAHILLFTSGYSVLSTAVPVLVSAPRYILGTITLGALMQSAQSFQHVASALSWPVDNMALVAQWRASVERVLSLIQALDDLEDEIVRPDPHRIVLVKTDKPTLRFDNLCISRLDGIVCASQVNDEIKTGERVLITGNTFTGSKLFKAIAGLWPWGEGRIELPDDEYMFFMPPRPYLPTGTLREAICYPSSCDDFSPSMLTKTLEMVGLAELIEQLDQIDDWEKALPREQQQRLGVVRVLLQKPKWILSETAFDSLDPEGEAEMMRLICQILPDAAMLTISNEPKAEMFHQRRIVL